jgi:drug/metabolite transporter (DMT)-like permease
MWFSIALISGSLYTISSLLTRYLLKGNKDSWAFSFFFSAIGALTALPFAMQSISLPKEIWPWFLLIFIGFLIVTQNYLSFSASNYIEASISGAITKFRILWVFILGLIFSQELLTINKTIGIICTLGAGLLIIGTIPKSHSWKGSMFAITATVVYAIVILLYKPLFTIISSNVLTFFIFFIPAVLNLLLMPNSIPRIKKYMKTNPRIIILTCIVGGLANLTMNYALSIGESSKVLVIIESFLVMVLCGEQLFLKEKSYVWQKIAAVFLATAGAIMMRIG